ncbi:MAG: carboxypeptidase-like regulatory domain-containing protein [Cyclobacteriaceae bacterium]|nr:carboxypeptidase-like regulatory domain-containing protein [Cyclobacteriaceae bacterium]
MNLKTTLLLLTVGAGFIVFQAGAQPQLTGRIVAAQTGEPLPFVNISIAGTTLGTTTDINGRYTLPRTPESPVRISYVGYKTQVLTAEDFIKTHRLIALEEAPTLLKELLITAGENPAHKIIRKAIANRQRNDPENIASFSYKAYHKFYATLAGTPKPDTAQQISFLKNSHFFVSETVSERKYVKPNLNKETITGNRMSGVKDPFFAVLATDFQPFTFYKEYIPLLDKMYRNPISPGSIGKYEYQLADTLYRGADTTYVITFEPLPGKIFECLKGQLYIHTNGYALEYVLAQPADEHMLTEIQIQQHYTQVEGHWFPQQLNTEFTLKEYKIKNRSVVYLHSTYLTDVQINAPLAKRDFGLLNLNFLPQANTRPEVFWQKERLDTLERKEQNTYKLYDSLSNRLGFLNKTMRVMEGVVTGKLKWGKFYVPLEDVLRINNYEGLRPGFGLQTGAALSEVLQANGYAAFGLKDKAAKYGAGLRINFMREKEFFLEGVFRQDVTEPGQSQFIKPPLISNGNQSYRNYLTSRMDSIRQTVLRLHTRPFRFTQLVVYANQQTNNPAYAYTFAAFGEQRQTFRIFESGLQVRFALRENHVQINQLATVANQAYPQLNVSISKAWPGTMHGQYEFIKTEFSLTHQFTVRGFGSTQIKVAGGLLQGAVPYPYLFNAPGAQYDRRFLNNLWVFNYFQTMGLYEFASDRYTYLFVTHNVGRLTGTGNKYVRPELLLLYNVGVGSLNNKALHEQITFNTLNKGFWESGLVLNNLFRFKYMNIFYWGLGAGVFYRGAYQFDEDRKNLFAKLSMTFSF